MTTGIPHARIVAKYRAPEYIVTVDDPAGPVRVRWRLFRAVGWRCDACGPMTAADCIHTFAAGLLLAEELLGLARLAELEPITEGTT